MNDIDVGDGKKIKINYDANGNILTRSKIINNKVVERRDFLGGIELVNGVIESIYNGQGRAYNKNAKEAYQLITGNIYGIENYCGDNIEIDATLKNGSQVDVEATNSIIFNKNTTAELGTNSLFRISPANYNPDWIYEYQISDHLGNVRVTYSDLNADGHIDGNTEIIESFDYYPYGLKMNGSQASKGLLQSPYANSFRYQYNGIESVNDFDLDLSMTLYRNLDPTIARWGSIDPKAELLMSWSPYNSMNANPISNIDPNGDSPFGAGLIGFAAGALATGLSVANNDDLNTGQKFLATLGGGIVGAGIGIGINSISKTGINNPISNTSKNSQQLSSTALIFSQLENLIRKSINQGKDQPKIDLSSNYPETEILTGLARLKNHDFGYEEVFRNEQGYYSAEVLENYTTLKYSDIVDFSKISSIYTRETIDSNETTFFTYTNNSIKIIIQNNPGAIISNDSFRYNPIKGDKTSKRYAGWDRYTIYESGKKNSLLIVNIRDNKLAEIWKSWLNF